MIAVFLAMWLYIPIHATIGQVMADPAPTEQVVQ